MSWPQPDPSIEIYPMPAFPQLEAGDLETSRRWYEALGFQHIFTMPGPDGAPVMVHLRWRKYADLMLVPGTSSGEQRGAGVTLYFNLEDGTIDELHQRALDAGAIVIQEPIDQPWNVRELMLADPDGYRIKFGAPVNVNLSWDELGKQVQGRMEG